MRKSDLLKKIKKLIKNEDSTKYEYANILYILIDEFRIDMDQHTIHSSYTGLDIDFLIDFIDNGISLVNYRELRFYKDFYASDLYNANLSSLMRKEGFNNFDGGSQFESKLADKSIDQISDRFAEIIEELLPKGGSSKVDSTKFIDYLLSKYSKEVDNYLDEIKYDYE